MKKVEKKAKKPGLVSAMLDQPPDYEDLEEGNNAEPSAPFGRRKIKNLVSKTAIFSESPAVQGKFDILESTWIETGIATWNPARYPTWIHNGSPTWIHEVTNGVTRVDQEKEELEKRDFTPSVKCFTVIL